MKTPKPKEKKRSRGALIPPFHRATFNFIRSQLALRGWTWGDLGKACNLSASMVQRAAKGIPMIRARRAVELALEMPFWTPIHEFEALNKRAALFGFDPVLTIRGAIFRHCRSIGFQVDVNLSKPRMLAALEAHLSTQTQNENQPAHV